METQQQSDASIDRAIRLLEEVKRLAVEEKKAEGVEV
jgi:hypothetical protein